MKTVASLLLAGCLLCLAACSPADPAVLTKEEKAKFSRNKSSNNTSSTSSKSAGYPQTAPVPDAAYASYVLDRQSEIIEILRLAMNLADGQGQIATDPCAVVTIADQSESSLVETIDFLWCVTIPTSAPVIQSGRLALKLDFDANKKLQAVTVTSAPLTDGYQLNPLVLVRGFTKAALKGASAGIVEQLNVGLVRVSEDPLVFQIRDAQSIVKADVSLPGLSVDHHTMSTQTLGRLTLAKQADGSLLITHQLRSHLNLFAVAEGGKPQGDPGSLDLSAASNRTMQGDNSELAGPCPQRQGQYQIAFDFFKNKHKGDLLSYDPTVISIVPQKGKTTSVTPRTCDQKSATAPFAGLRSVDWGQIFLF